VKLKTSLDKAKYIAKIALEKKGKDVTLMDMRLLSSMCDWFVIVSADSSRRIDTIAKTIQKDLSKEKIKPLSSEGQKSSFWKLLDYEDVIVHVFRSDVREFYELEQLWCDAPAKEIK